MLVLCLLVLFTGTVTSYRPVVVIHGILSAADSMSQLGQFILEAHPGTNVTVLNLFPGWWSVYPMWTQIQAFGDRVTAVMNEHPEGVHLIGYSQGGLIARGILHSIYNHTVRNFISLSSPQMGQYGDTDFIHLLFPNYVKKNLYRLFYSRYGQDFSVGNYWNDPHQQGYYRDYSNFLAVINNETLNNNSYAFKKSFSKLQNVVLIGGPDDGVITPWQSSHFGYYDSTEQIIEMKDQKIYQKDSFGLKTLDKLGRLHVYSVPGIPHLHWHINETVFSDYILPWLD